MDTATLTYPQTAVITLDRTAPAKNRQDIAASAPAYTVVEAMPLEKYEVFDNRTYKAALTVQRNGFNITTYEPVMEDAERLAVMRDHVRQLGYVKR